MHTTIETIMKEKIKMKNSIKTMSRVRSTVKVSINEPCLMCAQIKEPRIGKIFERPELINLIQKVLGISVSANIIQIYFIFVLF